MKQSMTGRDAKVLLAKAEVHIPELLEFVNTQQAEIEAAVAEAEAEADVTAAAKKKAPAGDLDEDSFDWEGDEEDDPDAELDAADEDTLSREEKSAKAWDTFILLSHAMRTFERDDMEYREQRAVEAFNAAAGVV
eukprot:1776575-Prymnesium_polylepis.1